MAGVSMETQPFLTQRGEEGPQRGTLSPAGLLFRHLLGHFEIRFRKSGKWSHTRVFRNGRVLSIVKKFIPRRKNCTDNAWS